MVASARDREEINAAGVCTEVWAFRRATQRRCTILDRAGARRSLLPSPQHRSSRGVPPPKYLGIVGRREASTTPIAGTKGPLQVEHGVHTRIHAFSASSTKTSTGALTLRERWRQRHRSRSRGRA